MPTEDDLELLLDELVELFRALTRPGNTTVQGLWGELAMLVWSADARLALASWHSNPKARHDFSADQMSIEVKSSARGLREHHARLEQLTPSEGGGLLVASLLLTEDELGSTVRDLAVLVASRLHQDSSLLGRLTTIIARSLGQAALEQNPLRFDLDAARRSLRVYDALSLPSIPRPMPPEIRSVEYVIDLSTTPPLSLSEARSRGAFFAALLPRDE